MATVRITSAVKNDVSRSIGALYAKQHNNVAVKMTKIDMRDVAREHFGPEFYEHAMRANADPRGPWAHQANSHTFVVEFESADGVKQARHVTIPYPAQIPVPERATMYSFRIPLKKERPEYEQVVALLREIDRINQEHNKLNQALQAVLNKCVTLKQVLDIWPTAIEFVSPETREQHNRVNEPKARGPRTKPEIDDSTKVALLSARMLAQ